MKDKELKKFIEGLKKEETLILSELSGFAQKDSHVEGKFNVPFPDEGRDVDANAREMQEFERLNALKNSLEKRLRDVRFTIEKVKEGKYGKCETCSVTIDAVRLKVLPMARVCMDCARRNPGARMARRRGG